MHCHCQFGKVKSSSCSSVDIGAADTLRYAIYRTGSDGYQMCCDTISHIPELCVSLSNDLIKRLDIHNDGPSARLSTFCLSSCNDTGSICVV